MTPVRELRPSSWVPSLLAALTTFVTLLAWTKFAENPAGFMVPILGACLMVAVLGMALRMLRLPAVLVALAQLVLVLVWLNHREAAALSLGGWVPTPSSLHALVGAFGDSVLASQAYAAPVPQSVPEFYPLMILAGALTAVLVDFLAVGLRRAPLAGLPLLALYTAPVSVLDGGVSWLKFAAAALVLPVPDRLGGGPAALALGAPALPRRPDLRHPDHDREQPGGLGLRAQDRSDRHRRGRGRPAAGADVQRLVLRRRQRTGRRRRGRGLDLQPDDRPQARPHPGRRRRAHPDDHHGERPVLPPDHRARLLRRHRLAPLEPRHPGQAARRRRGDPAPRPGPHDPVPGGGGDPRGERQLQVTLAADAVPRRLRAGAGRLALRPLDAGLHQRRRQPDHRRHLLPAAVARPVAARRRTSPRRPPRRRPCSPRTPRCRATCPPR